MAISGLFIAWGHFKRFFQAKNRPPRLPTLKREAERAFMNPYLKEIRMHTSSYAAWQRWQGNQHIRGFEMHQIKMRFETVAALYRFYRRRELLNKAITENWKGLHP